MIIDAAVAIILIIFGIRSFRSGLEGELNGAFGWFVAIVAAIGFSEPLGNLLAGKVPSLSELGPYLSFLVIILILRLLFGFLIKLLPDEPKGLIGIALNVSAVALGFLKGVFFVGVILLLLSTKGFATTLEPYTKDSILLPHLKNFAVFVVGFITKNVPNVKELLDRLS
jgi:uncharacterized membrane protein required for colicin V production